MKGFEKDVGSKTTLRITYPEGAMQRPEQYERDSLFVLAGFKWQDFKWLKYIVYKERVVSSPASAPSLDPLAQSPQTPKGKHGREARRCCPLPPGTQVTTQARHRSFLSLL